jgi:hypothetical protein
VGLYRVPDASNLSLQLQISLFSIVSFFYFTSGPFNSFSWSWDAVGTGEVGSTSRNEIKILNVPHPDSLNHHIVLKQKWRK